MSEQDADAVPVERSGGEQVISTRSPELHEGTLVEVGSAHQAAAQFGRSVLPAHSSTLRISPATSHSH